MGGDNCKAITWWLQFAEFEKLFGQSSVGDNRTESILYLNKVPKMVLNYGRTLI